MTENPVAVRFASRTQLLEAVTTLPKELGPLADYTGGEIVFVSRRNRPTLSHSSTTLWFDGSVHRFLVNSDAAIVATCEGDEVEMIEFSQALLLKGGIPENVRIQLFRGNVEIDNFRDNLLPLLQRNYLIDHANLGLLHSLTGDWGIEDDLVLLTKNSRKYEGTTATTLMGVSARKEVRGWFTRLVEDNRNLFYYSERAPDYSP